MYEHINGKTIMKKEHQEKEYQVSMKVTGGDIEKILAMALKAGPCLGVKLNHTKQSYWVRKPPWMSYVQFATQILLEGGVIQLNDIRDPIAYHELTLRKLINGINAYMNSTASNMEHTSYKGDRLPEHLNSSVAIEIIINAIFGRR